MLILFIKSNFMLMFILLIIITGCLTVISSNSEGFLPIEIPNPMIDPKGCNRDVTKSNICDPNNLLSKDDKDIIEGYINSIPVETAQLAVLVIEKMNPLHIGYSSIDKSTELFARKVHDTWGVGDKVTNNGILIFVSKLDRSIYISIGKGVSHKLNDFDIDGAIENMKPYLKSSAYGQAFQHAVLEIRSILLSSNKTRYHRRSSSSELDDYALPLFGLFAIFLFGYGYLERRKLSNLKKGEEAINKFMRELSDSTEQPSYASKSCPICLEDFPSSTNTDTNSHSLDVESNLTNRKPTEDNNSNKSSLPNRPMALKCGHTFCFTCLEKHLKSAGGNKCPICRKSVKTGQDDVVPPPTRGSRSNNAPDDTSCSSTSQSSGSYTNTNTFRTDEFHYRANRLHYLYPDVVTTSLLRSMTSSINTGSVSTLRSTLDQRRVEVQRMITDIAKRNEARSSGAGGSSYSFGGGRSFGGRGGRF
mmetsp:Transcript_23024/g.20914  ORF Transcript_23024/g.20914 Transcript_23024/m.20914 type:complete len:475 (-) Transcript_23024:64-1488(-)